MIKPNPGNPLDYWIVDCDNHYYEPDDCFTRHIEERYRKGTVWVDRSRPDGLGTMMLGDDRLTFFSVGVADFVGEPGSMEEFFRGKDDTQNQVNANPIKVEDFPEFTDRERRLQKMDEQCVQATVMIPTLGVGVEYQLRSKPELLYPSLRAFNRWLHEDWGYGADGRIFGIPMISLLDVDAAVAELDRLLKEGVRLVNLTPGPIAGRSPADSYYDPFWSRVEESGTKLVYHIGETGCNQLYAAPWGEPATPPSHRYSAFNTYVGIGERSITDTLASLIFLDLFGRFPQLEVLAVEFGASWVPRFLNTIDKIHRLGDHKTRWRYGKPALPSEVFRQHVRVVPFYEDDIGELLAAASPEAIINGSDYPHPEGLAWPTDMAHYLLPHGAETTRRVMRTTASRILGLAD